MCPKTWHKTHFFSENLAFNAIFLICDEELPRCSWGSALAVLSRGPSLSLAATTGLYFHWSIHKILIRMKTLEISLECLPQIQSMRYKNAGKWGQPICTAKNHV